MDPSASATARWAGSGAMALTGRPGGPPLVAPAGIALAAAMALWADDLATATGRLGRVVRVDGPALLGERAALAGLSRQGRASAGGATRLVPVADGWMALALARADDVAALAAWLEVEVDEDDPWPAVVAAARARPGAALVERGRLLGLPCSVLGSVRDAVAPRRVALAGDEGAPPVPALDGLVVVDLSSLWAGPLCTDLLRRAGARVVKVESARRPDGARSGPAPFFDLLNAGKESVAVDLEAPGGVAALVGWLERADVVVESSRPRALAQLGIDPCAVAAAGRLRVWLSITAYGRPAPMGEWVGFGDDTAVAAGLVAWDDAGPCFCADAAADPATGLRAALAVVDHLATGGRWLLDVALARVAAAALAGGRVAGAGRSWSGPVAAPRARPVPGAGPALGADGREP
jgi:crotonobetainyl-CoA:carnitine CoA-transferase CaiB-like acyl-CoA transferase